MKIEDYWEFNIEKFVNDYPSNKIKLDDLEESLAEVTEMKAQNYGSPPGTPGRGDTVPAVVEKKEFLEKQIKETKRIVDAYEYASKALTEKERLVIQYCFFERGYKSACVRKLSEILHIEVSHVYNIRGKALKKLKNVILGKSV